MAEAIPINRGDSASEAQFTADTLQNLTRGIGGRGDTLRNTRHVFRERLPHVEAEALYLNDWLGAACVDAIPEDMVREGREIKGIEGDKLDEFEAMEREFDVWGHLLAGLTWGRLYGGAGAVLGLDGTGEMHEPLEMDRIKQGALKWITVLDRWHLVPDRIDSFNPLRPNWDRPEFYRAYSGPDQIHRSRILFFRGIKLPYRLAIRNWFWGGSVLERVVDAVQNAGLAQHGVASLIAEAKVDVFKIPGLMFKLMTPEGTAEIMERIRLMNEGKSYLNAVIMDSNEEWDQKTAALTGGLEKIVEQFLDIVAGAAGIPVTRLLGKSPKGLNNGGEENTRNYYDRVKFEQKQNLAPQLRIMDEVLLRHTFGNMPDEFESTFKTLWMQTEEDRSTTQKNDADRDIQLLDATVIQPSHIAGRLLLDGVYPTMEQDWVTELERAEKGIDLPGEKPDVIPPQLLPGQPGEVDPNAEPEVDPEAEPKPDDEE